MKSLAIRSNPIIKRRTQPQWLLWLIVVLPLIRLLLSEYLFVPAAADYILDLAWLALTVYVLCSPAVFRRKDVAVLGAWVALFLGYTLTVYFFRFQSPLYYLWGMRNNFRFYVAFFAFCAFMTRDSAEEFLGLMDKLFWLNLVLTLIQYAMGYRFDYLGGLFGTTIGCNSYSNLFLLIVVSKSLVYCFNKQESLSLCMVKCFAALLVAALAELKFFFVEFLFAAALVFCMTRFSMRKMLVILAASVGVLVGIAILTQLYPHFKDAFIPKNLIGIAADKKGYTMKDDFNRLTAITCANEQFLATAADRLFGLGLGNCTLSSIPILQSPFSLAHADRTNYYWFSTSYVYLETGYIGLTLFFGFFGLVFCVAHRREKRGASLLHCQLAKVMALCSVLLGIYNASLQSETGYMVYFILALPFMKNGQPPERAESYE